MSECNNHLATAKHKPKSSTIGQKSAANPTNMSFKNEDSDVDYDSSEDVLDSIVVRPPGRQQQRHSAALVAAKNHANKSSAFGSEISPVPKSSKSISQALSAFDPNFSSTSTSSKDPTTPVSNMSSSIDQAPSGMGLTFSSPPNLSETHANLDSNMTSSVSPAPSTPNSITRSKPYFSIDTPLENWEPDSDSEDGRHISLIQDPAECEEVRKRRVERSRKAKISDKLKERWATGKMNSSILSRKEAHQRKKDVLSAKLRQNASQQGQDVPTQSIQQPGRRVPRSAYARQRAAQRGQTTPPNTGLNFSPAVPHARNPRKLIRLKVKAAPKQLEQQPGRPTGQSLCVVCGKHGGNFCGSCNSVEYCSQACQAYDWELHKSVCQIYQSFLKVQSRPSPNHRCALLFPVANEEPQFVWLSPGEYGLDIKDALSYLDEDKLEIKSTPVDCGELFMELDHRFQIWSRATAPKEGLNRGIQKLGEGCLWKEWRGPIMITSHTNDFLNSGLDVKPGDFVFVTRFFKDQIPKPNPIKREEDVSQPENVRLAPSSTKESELSLKVWTNHAAKSK